MSTQKGNMKKGAPRHQNSFAFKHNPNSKKTAKILSSPIEGLCKRCHDIITWKKKYRKYKPLTKPGTCKCCRQKTVTSAYHEYCGPCASEQRVCAKCLESKDIIPSERELEETKAEEEKELKLALENMKERERRTVLRKLQKEEDGEYLSDSDEEVKQQLREMRREEEQEEEDDQEESGAGEDEDSEADEE